ncbi:MAG: Smr/MutS family protein [Treponema sp.]|jgi:DNA-nicking Smr family endonuclease|nr:Smr/MutS family protein [Treponema sp.]
MMDFGDILDKWDRQSAGNRRIEPEQMGGSLPEQTVSPAKRANPLDTWLRINGVYDKDRDFEALRTASGERRRRLLRKKPDGVIDLHGLTQDEAWTALEDFFGEARQRGFEKLLIIHGKGNHSEGEGVLRDLTRGFIEKCPFAGEMGHNSGAEGGRGSTWVLLKDEPTSPDR